MSSIKVLLPPAYDAPLIGVCAPSLFGYGADVTALHW